MLMFEDHASDDLPFCSVVALNKFTDEIPPDFLIFVPPPPNFLGKENDLPNAFNLSQNAIICIYIVHKTLLKAFKNIAKRYFQDLWQRLFSSLLKTSSTLNFTDVFKEASLIYASNII
jgi:hypothetical protein